MPVAFAFILLAAHFHRAAMLASEVLAVMAIGLLFVRQAWAARTLQLLLVLGAVEWLRTLAVLVQERQAQHAPFLRLAAILGCVAVATAACALVFRGRVVRARFDLSPRDHGS